MEHLEGEWLEQGREERLILEEAASGLAGARFMFLLFCACHFAVGAPKRRAASE